MKISIITSVYNCKDTIREAIESVLSQSYEDIEYIIIDGGSTDGTIEIIKEYENKIDIFSSSSDNGIYDGFNRGISLASGDIIGFLHADDLYENHDVVKKIDTVFKNEQADAIYGDLVYVYKENINKVLRYWISEQFSSSKLKKGWMPPHPTFYVKRELYEKFGTFNKSFKIAADYDFMLKVLTCQKCKIIYIPEVLYRMRTGGASNRSLQNIFQKWEEDLKVIKRHKIGGLNTLFMKNFSKIPQFFKNFKEHSV